MAHEKSKSQAAHMSDGGWASKPIAEQVAWDYPPAKILGTPPPKTSLSCANRPSNKIARLFNVVGPLSLLPWKVTSEKSRETLLTVK